MQTGFCCWFFSTQIEQNEIHCICSHLHWIWWKQQLDFYISFFVCAFRFFVVNGKSHKLYIHCKANSAHTHTHSLIRSLSCLSRSELSMDAWIIHSHRVYKSMWLTKAHQSFHCHLICVAMHACKRVVVNAFVTSNVYYINHPKLSPCGIATIWIASIKVQHTPLASLTALARQHRTEIISRILYLAFALNSVCANI